MHIYREAMAVALREIYLRGWRNSSARSVAALGISAVNFNHLFHSVAPNQFKCKLGGHGYQDAVAIGAICGRIQHLPTFCMSISKPCTCRMHAVPISRNQAPNLSDLDVLCKLTWLIMTECRWSRRTPAMLGLSLSAAWRGIRMKQEWDRYRCFPLENDAVTL